MKCVNIGIFKFHLQFFFAIILTFKKKLFNLLKTNGIRQPVVQNKQSEQKTLKNLIGNFNSKILKKNNGGDVVWNLILCNYTNLFLKWLHFL